MTEDIFEDENVFSQSEIQHHIFSEKYLKSSSNSRNKAIMQVHIFFRCEDLQRRKWAGDIEVRLLFKNVAINDFQWHSAIVIFEYLSHPLSKKLPPAVDKSKYRDPQTHS